MAIELLKPWNGFPVGHRSEAFGAGVEDALIRRGIAREIDTRSSDQSDSGADHSKRSEKAPRNRRK
jgi:hypothetical protein